MAPAQQGFWPQAEPVYAPSVHELILNQVLYYFSPENLTRDDFLRGHMCPTEGWLSIQLLGTFNRLRSLTTDVNVIAEVRTEFPSTSSSSPLCGRARPCKAINQRLIDLIDG